MGGLLQSAHWPFLIDVYFFLGGLAGGAFVIATAALIVDSVRYRDVSRVGYYLALVALQRTLAGTEAGEVAARRTNFLQTRLRGLEIRTIEAKALDPHPARCARRPPPFRGR